MPKGSKVDEVYEAIRRKGEDKGKAARIAQAQTGESLKTGQKIKKMAPDFEDPDYGHLDRKHSRATLPPDMGHQQHHEGAQKLRETLDKFRNYKAEE